MPTPGPRNSNWRKTRKWPPVASQPDIQVSELASLLQISHLRHKLASFRKMPLHSGTAASEP
jgi:hypothetical protein